MAEVFNRRILYLAGFSVNAKLHGATAVIPKSSVMTKNNSSFLILRKCVHNFRA